MFINYSQLSKSELFSRIPVMDIPKAVECLQGFTKSFSKNELIYKGNSENNFPGIVLKGNLSVTQLFPDGSMVFIRSITPGNLFGLYMSCGGDDSTYVTAAEDSTILFLKLPVDGQSSQCICKYRMIIMENLVTILVKNNKYLNQKIKIISRGTIRDKLMQFFQIQSRMQKSKEITINMTREKLAEYICSDRSAVSRELSKMDKEGIIKISGKKIIL